jgi:hypothetical protein
VLTARCFCRYHERAIVFNEKNLIRLWDIAYDGYNGGKEDRHVDWLDPDDTQKFRNNTTDVTKNYQGASMMVMAFKHDQSAEAYRGFQPNWPSPIVFDDNYDHHNPRPEEPRAIIGYDNLHVVNINEFRVFNKPLYSGYK